MTTEARWGATPAHLRAVAAGVLLAAIAVVAQRPDLAVMAAPFLAAAAFGGLRRPSSRPRAELHVDAATMTEGQATSVRLTVDDLIDGELPDGVVAAAATSDPWVQFDPPGAARAVPLDAPRTEVPLVMRAVRWGRHEVRCDAVRVTSPAGAFRISLIPSSIVVTALPLADTFAATDALPRPSGLVGLHRSRRYGEGVELAEVRPFRPGDRLRRINWPVSSRTGTLHVTAAWSDRDTEVMLLLDTEHDLGISEGVDGRASSLDVAVRAAAAIAEHYLRTGDRVALTDVGQRVRTVPVGSGRQHLRRVLDVLVASSPGVVRSQEARRLGRIRAGSLVVALSPLLGGAGVAQIAQLVRHRHAVVVIDTLPPHALESPDPWRALAWRVRMLERGVEIDRLAELGVPVVQWRGRGTLDDVLRVLSRVAVGPRLIR
jgi:uncharacterized protein (DUF58 family)